MNTVGYISTVFNLFQLFQPQTRPHLNMVEFVAVFLYNKL